ncbi:MAG TPA: hypothetical protein VIM12_13445 [Noviherbaspirillum sp.]|uniref:hypothetical protein n=1 Tax=Noviherbaspirillum sp. TaxID=1926288 RepID=UPI002F9546D6
MRHRGDIDVPSPDGHGSNGTAAPFLARADSLPDDAAAFAVEVHALLRDLIRNTPEVQRQAAMHLRTRHGDRLSTLANKAIDCLVYRADVTERYHPEQGLPRQYGWEISPVRRGVYDIQIAALRAKGGLSYPLYRMPRLDQLAAEVARQAHDPEWVECAGLAIARMGGFFHQVAAFFRIHRAADAPPAVDIVVVDSEGRGEEITLQLADALRDKGVAARVAAVNARTQFSPAGCPVFSAYNVACMGTGSGDDDAATEGAGGHRLTLASHLADTLCAGHGGAGPAGGEAAVRRIVVDGKEVSAPSLYRVCQSEKRLREVFAPPALDPLLSAFYRQSVSVLRRSPQGETVRQANFLLERTHEEQVGLMLDYLDDLLALEPGAGAAAFQQAVREVRQSSLHDDDDLAADRACAARQLADEIGQEVMWTDISPVLADEERRTALLALLDGGLSCSHMRLGYLQREGYPVFSSWKIEDGKTWLCDDRYFHVHDERKPIEMPVSAYMQADTGIRAGAQYNFLAVPAPQSRKWDDVLQVCEVNIALPRARG